MPLSDTSQTRRPGISLTPSDFLLATAILLMLGLWIFTRAASPPAEPIHLHDASAQGGVVISFADDRYHAEALVEQGGRLRLLMLGRSPNEVIDVPSQTPVAYIDSGAGAVIGVPLAAEPQAGDRPGRTSQFIAQLPVEFAGRPIKVTIAALQIDQQRYRIGFTWPPEFSQPHPSLAGMPGMPKKIQDDAERQLYLQPAGLYTAADIRANGNLTASQKFVGFKAQHDFDPQPGDLLCPITQTKANPDCTWILGGQRYTFCCPPCIDEFVELAKQHPDRIRSPEAYVK